MEHRYPRGHLFYRRLDRAFPLAVAAEGAWIVDEDGKRYLDASGGAAVVNLGHGVGGAAEAMAEEARRLGYVNGTQFTHRAAENLAEELAEVLPGDLGYSYFLSSGSEAVEAAVKLARQYWVERGRPGKWKVVARAPSYHGNTLTALSLSGRPHYRRSYGPLLTDFPRIPAPDPWRRADDAAATGEALEEAILAAGPETISAFLFEPIGGTSTGAMMPSAEYHRRVVEICRRHDVLLVADEVLTGMGRTGRWLAAEHYPGLLPDIVTLGKGLNGGSAPLSAVVARPHVVETLARGSGAFQHAQTYCHSPAACAAGLATLRFLREHRLVERSAAMEPRLLGSLARLRSDSRVGDVRGRGLFAAVELVEDRNTKEPFARSARLAERWTERAFAHGLVVWPNVGHVDGERGDLVIVAPPFSPLPRVTMSGRSPG